MSEQEVKLNVAPAARAGVEREMSRGDSRSIHLHAMYFDTPARELARAKIALRLRLEGDVWIQTLKMPGKDAISRIELNHTRPGPILDLSVYAGSEVEAALTSVQGELGLRYETDVLRIIRKHRSRQGAVEIAFDRGEVRASGFTLPICELEFELLSGRVAAIFEVARAWHHRHGLILDARSKSERGDALASLASDLDFKPLDDTDPADARSATVRSKRAARIAAFWAPRPILSVKLQADQTPAQALATVTAECLDQITRNAAALAEVDTASVNYQAGHPDHVHQLRVGVRRLRSAWRLFDGIAVLPPAELQDALKTFFGNFGSNRDRDVLNASVLPKLLAAGMPVFADDTPDESDDSATLARAKGFQGLLLSLLEWSVTPQPSLAAAQAIDAAAQASVLAAGAGAASATTLATTVAAGTVSGEQGDVPAQGTHRASSHAPAPMPGATDVPADASTRALAEASSAAHPTSSHIVPTIIPLGAATAQTRLDTLLMDRLHLWHKQIVKRGKHFASIDIEKKHSLRKKVKLLRYSLGFSESLLGASRLRAYRKHLAVVQDLLGEFNDMAVAHDTYLARAATTNEAWFAVGWLSAEQSRIVLRAQTALTDLGGAPGFWK
ncbi:MAG: CYTH and CHAD domain-containing protein [Burkholderiaceae bacterium]